METESKDELELYLSKYNQIIIGFVVHNLTTGYVIWCEPDTISELDMPYNMLTLEVYKKTYNLEILTLIGTTSKEEVVNLAKTCLLLEG